MQTWPMTPGMQHEPREGPAGQLAAAQVTPLFQVPCRFVHTAWVVTKQLALLVESMGLQHAPRGRQASLPQEVLLPR